MLQARKEAESMSRHGNTNDVHVLLVCEAIGSIASYFRVKVMRVLNAESPVSVCLYAIIKNSRHLLQRPAPELLASISEG
jgi:hypothetical protein